jgi:hypothetical protein
MLSTAHPICGIRIYLLPGQTGNGQVTYPRAGQAKAYIILDLCSRRVLALMMVCNRIKRDPTICALDIAEPYDS